MAPHLDHQAHHITKGKGNVRNFGQRIWLSVNLLKPNSSIFTIRIDFFTYQKTYSLYLFFEKKIYSLSWHLSWAHHNTKGKEIKVLGKKFCAHRLFETQYCYRHQIFCPKKFHTRCTSFGSTRT